MELQHQLPNPGHRSLMPMDHTPQNKQRLGQSQGQQAFIPTLYTAPSERQGPVLAVTISHVILIVSKLGEKMVSEKCATGMVKAREKKTCQEVLGMTSRDQGVMKKLQKSDSRPVGKCSEERGLEVELRALPENNRITKV